MAVAVSSADMLILMLTATSYPRLSCQHPAMDFDSLYKSVMLCRRSLRRTPRESASRSARRAVPRMAGASRCGSFACAAYIAGPGPSYCLRAGRALPARPWKPRCKPAKSRRTGLSSVAEVLHMPGCTS